MSAKSGTPNTDGREVVQYAYTNNTDLKDEWSFFSVSTIINGVPHNIYSNGTHSCIPCAVTNLAAYWCSEKGFSGFNLSTAALQESRAAEVHQAMAAAGGAGRNDKIQYGFDVFNHTIGNAVYKPFATNCWRYANAFDWETIMAEICSDKPVMLGFAKTNDSPYTQPHMTVCIGYSIENNVCYVWVVDAITNDYVERVFNINTYNDFIAKVMVSN